MDKNVKAVLEKSLARAKRDLDENEWHLQVALEDVQDYEQAVQRNLEEIASLEAALRGEA